MQTSPRPEQVVIDLTEDDEMVGDSMGEDTKESITFKKDSITFVSTVAHRQPSWNGVPASSISQKRKNIDSADDASISSHKDGFKDGLKDGFKNVNGHRSSTPNSSVDGKDALKNIKSHRHSTPSSSVHGKAFPTSNLSVVVPSPRQVLQKSPLGTSEKYFPIKALEYEKIARRAYPEAHSRTCSIVPLSNSSSQAPQVPRGNKIKSTRERLLESINSVSGPKEVTISVNDQKLAMLSANFLFVNDYVIGKGVTPVDDEFNAGCDCRGHCDPETCDCLVQEEDSDKFIVPYQRKGDQLVLRPDFLKRKSMIYECSYRCTCAGDCWNHVVQRGRQVRLEIFDTGDRGLGLRSPDPIIAGQYIDRYLGEVITKADADAREAAGQEGQSYLFGLDFITEDDETMWVVDGQKMGSATRFINHSCNPNCKIIPVSTDNHGDDRLYYLAFFARRDIPAGTELTFDYNPSWDGPRVNDPDVVQCKCGEKKCRGQLWPNARKTQTSG